MQLHLPTHLENRGLYTNTEYDDIRLGEWRVVWSYCPRRHRYVRDLAAPILAAQGIAADDPDAVIAQEPLPGSGEKSPRQRIVEWMGDRQLTAREVADGMGISAEIIHRYLSDKRTFTQCGMVPNRDPSTRHMRPTVKVYRVADNPALFVRGRGSAETYAARQKRREDLLIAHIREHGDITVDEAVELLGKSRDVAYEVVNKSARLAKYKIGHKMFFTTREGVAE